jgi:hypothetical protein
MSGNRRPCDDCQAVCDTADHRVVLPLTHRPGQLIARVDVRHEADCRFMARLSSGIMPWQQIEDQPITACDGCIPTYWWDKLPANVLRIEIYHADDCSESRHAVRELVAAHD